MATSTSGTKKGTTQALQSAEKKVAPAQKFLTKITNDWVFNYAGAMAYSLLMSIFPIAVALLSIFGFFFGGLGPQAQDQFIAGLTHVLPAQSGISGAVVKQIYTQLAKNAGVLGIIAVVLALFNGSRLFVQMEGFFDYIYHARQRVGLKQNLVALIMLLLFVILVPIMTALAAAPAFITTILKPTPIGQVPGIASVLSIFFGLLAALIFFWTIYIIVPNQPISWRRSWLGALVAAIALQLYLTLFPLYVAHFLSSYGGAISLVVLLVFFYYFAIILLLGAEVNAYFLEKITVTPVNPVLLLHLTTSHLPKSEEQKQEQAALGYKDSPIDDEAKKAGLLDVPAAATSDVHDIQARKPDEADAQATPSRSRNGQPAAQQNAEHGRGSKKAPKKSPSSKTAAVAAAVAGSGLAFLVQTLRLRRKKP